LLAQQGFSGQTNPATLTFNPRRRSTPPHNTLRVPVSPKGKLSCESSDIGALRRDSLSLRYLVHYQIYRPPTLPYLHTPQYLTYTRRDTSMPRYLDALTSTKTIQPSRSRKHPLPPTSFAHLHLISITKFSFVSGRAKKRLIPNLISHYHQ